MGLTIYTINEIVGDSGILSDNTSGYISAQNVRDSFWSLYNEISSNSAGSNGPVGATGPVTKEYVSTFSQKTTLTPTTPTILSNTMTSTPIWKRSGVGKYQLSCSDFISNKTYISGVTDRDGIGNTAFNLWDEDSIIGYYQIYTSPGNIFMEVFDITFTRVDWGTLMGSSVLSFPKIEVYP